MNPPEENYIPPEDSFIYPFLSIRWSGEIRIIYLRLKHDD